MMKHLLLIAGLALLSGKAFAHGDHIGPNGGYVKHAAVVHLELITVGSSVKVYVLDPDGDKPVKIDPQSTARATILSAGAKEVVSLTAKGPNLLAGQAKAPIAPDAKVALTVSIPGKANIPALTYQLALKSKLR